MTNALQIIDVSQIHQTIEIEPTIAAIRAAFIAHEAGQLLCPPPMQILFHEEDGASSTSLQSPTQSPPALVVEGSENVAYSASEQSSIRTAATPTDESRDTGTSVCESEVNTGNCLNMLNS